MNVDKKISRRRIWGVTAVLAASLALTACGAGGGKPLGKATVTEGELDTVVASYTYSGKTEDVTAREVILQNGTLDAAKKDDDTYAIPSASSIVQYVQNEIILSKANSEGIEISDDDMTAYAKENLGTDDYESIASSYSMDVDTVKQLIKNSLLMTKLRDKVVGTSESAQMPEAPSAPEVPTKNDKGEDLSDDEAKKAEEDAYNKVDKQYADYIIKLVGDEWDAKGNKWKAKDGYYATALADYEITKDGASYNAAQAAYYAAYEQYSTKQTEVSDQWNEYVNGLLTNASVTINTLTAS